MSEKIKCWWDMPHLTHIFTYFKGLYIKKTNTFPRKIKRKMV